MKREKGRERRKVLNALVFETKGKEAICKILGGQQTSNSRGVCMKPFEIPKSCYFKNYDLYKWLSTAHKEEELFFVVHARASAMAF